MYTSCFFFRLLLCNSCHGWRMSGVLKCLPVHYLKISEFESLWLCHVMFPSNGFFIHFTDMLPCFLMLISDCHGEKQTDRQKEGKKERDAALPFLTTLWNQLLHASLHHSVPIWRVCHLSLLRTTLYYILLLLFFYKVQLIYYILIILILYGVTNRHHIMLYIHCELALWLECMYNTDKMLCLLLCFISFRIHSQFTVLYLLRWNAVFQGMNDTKHVYLYCEYMSHTLRGEWVILGVELAVTHESLQDKMKTQSVSQFLWKWSSCFIPLTSIHRTVFDCTFTVSLQCSSVLSRVIIANLYQCMVRWILIKRYC